MRWVCKHRAWNAKGVGPRRPSACNVAFLSCAQHNGRMRDQMLLLQQEEHTKAAKVIQVSKSWHICTRC